MRRSETHLVERGVDVIRELDLRYRRVAHSSKSNPEARDTLLRQGRIEHTFATCCPVSILWGRMTTMGCQGTDRTLLLGPVSMESSQLSAFVGEGPPGG